MIDIENEHDALRLIDAVPDTVFASSGAPLPRERRTQRGTDT